MRIAMGHADTTLADLTGTLAALTTQAHAAAAAGAELLLLPELAAFGGYPPRDLLERSGLVERQWHELHQAAQAWPLPVAVGAIEPLSATMTSGMPHLAPHLANVLAVFDHGRLVGVHRKCRLPAYDVFDEPRHFQPGSGGTIITLRGRKIGLTVCEDLWDDASAGYRYACDPLADLIGKCELILNASASPYHLGKPELRAHVVRAAARRAGCPVGWCNLLGAHDELLFDGGWLYATPAGALSSGPRWCSGVTVVTEPTPQETIASPSDALRADKEPSVHPHSDLWTALTFGLRGYCKRTGQSRVVLGLSGGIDSAVMAALAVDALGADQVTGVLMPGPYSSRGSVTDALTLAENLHIRTAQCAISRAWEMLQGELEPLAPHGLSDLASQNLQSRLRGTLIMAAANQLGAMALTTGNKSELAVGYCTIYGDMNGGLAPLGDVFKTTVFALARWINRDHERIPAASISKPPSAELRPDQTDQDTLPPYAQLDHILRAFIEDGCDPAAIDDDPAVVARVVRLVELNEFKRRQAAPVLRVTCKAFGVGRRIPLARHF